MEKLDKAVNRLRRKRGDGGADLAEDINPSDKENKRHGKKQEKQREKEEKKARKQGEREAKQRKKEEEKIKKQEEKEAKQREKDEKKTRQPEEKKAKQREKDEEKTRKQEEKEAKQRKKEEKKTRKQEEKEAKQSEKHEKKKRKKEEKKEKKKKKKEEKKEQQRRKTEEKKQAKEIKKMGKKNGTNDQASQVAASASRSTPEPESPAVNMPVLERSPRQQRGPAFASNGGNGESTMTSSMTLKAEVTDSPTRTSVYDKPHWPQSPNNQDILISQEEVEVHALSQEDKPTCPLPGQVSDHDDKVVPDTENSKVPTAQPNGTTKTPASLSEKSGDDKSKSPSFNDSAAIPAMSIPGQQRQPDAMAEEHTVNSTQDYGPLETKARVEIPRRQVQSRGKVDNVQAKILDPALQQSVREETDRKEIEDLEDTSNSHLPNEGKMRVAPDSQEHFSHLPAAKKTGSMFEKDTSEKKSKGKGNNAKENLRLLEETLNISCGQADNSPTEDMAREVDNHRIPNVKEISIGQKIEELKDEHQAIKQIIKDLEDDAEQEKEDQGLLSERFNQQRNRTIYHDSHFQAMDDPIGQDKLIPKFKRLYDRSDIDSQKIEELLDQHEDFIEDESGEFFLEAVRSAFSAVEVFYKSARSEFCSSLFKSLHGCTMNHSDILHNPGTVRLFSELLRVGGGAELPKKIVKDTMAGVEQTSFFKKLMNRLQGKEGPTEAFKDIVRSFCQNCSEIAWYFHLLPVPVQIFHEELPTNDKLLYQARIHVRNSSSNPRTTNISEIMWPGLRRTSCNTSIVSEDCLLKAIVVTG